MPESNGKNQSHRDVMLARTCRGYRRVADKPDGSRSPQVTTIYTFRPILHDQQGMPISYVERSVHFSIPPSQIACSIARGMGYAPYREIASILPGESSNIAGIIKSPSLGLYVLADIDVVFASFERRKGIVLSALAKIRSLYPRNVMGYFATLQIVC